MSNPGPPAWQSIPAIMLPTLEAPIFPAGPRSNHRFVALAHEADPLLSQCSGIGLGLCDDAGEVLAVKLYELGASSPAAGLAGNVLGATQFHGAVSTPGLVRMKPSRLEYDAYFVLPAGVDPGRIEARLLELAGGGHWTQQVMVGASYQLPPDIFHDLHEAAGRPPITSCNRPRRGAVLVASATLSGLRDPVHQVVGPQTPIKVAWGEQAPISNQEFVDYARQFLGADWWADGYERTALGVTFPAGSNKCNLFIAEMLAGVGLDVVWSGGFLGFHQWPMPVEGWFDKDVDINGWSEPNHARPGAIASNAHHCGIVSQVFRDQSGALQGSTISASSIVGKVVENDWGFRRDERRCHYRQREYRLPEEAPPLPNFRS